MAEKNITTNQIEEKLLERELKLIIEKLGKIGKEIEEVFKPYYPIKENLEKELDAFIKENMFARSYYRAGFTTEAGHVYKYSIPESLKKAILKKVTSDFIERVKNIEEIVEEIIEDMQP